MTSLNIAPNLLDILHLQMASEALNLSETVGQLKKDSLEAGNGHTTIMTELEIKNFISKYEFVTQQENTSTGFSGSIFREKSTGKIYVSLRSTEFLDDAVRDCQATNSLEIADHGWAFGQISDMSTWLKSLPPETKALLSNSPGGVDITGYSLGGHLATALALLNKSDALGFSTGQVSTFNGAGVGRTTNGCNISTVLADFETYRANASALVEETGYGRNAYNAIVAASQTADLTTSEGVAAYAIKVRYIKEKLMEQGSSSVLTAISNINTILDEVVRVASLKSSEGPSATKPIFVPMSNCAQINIDYQLAMLHASVNTEAMGIKSGLDNTLGAPSFISDNELNEKITNYAADTPYAMVSNSQWHYGTQVLIPIENQPLYRGNAVWNAFTASMAAGFQVKLLTNNYSLNDFGDTHSIVLLNDSLTVLNFLNKLTASDNSGVFKQIIENSSSVYAIQLNAALPAGVNNQRWCDGNALESIVSSVALAVGYSASIPMGAYEGGTWFELSNRTAFLNAILNLDTFIQNKQLIGNLSIVTKPVTLQDIISDFNLFFQVLNQSPVLIKGGGLEMTENSPVKDFWTQLICQTDTDTSYLQSILDTYQVLREANALDYGRVEKNILIGDSANADKLTAAINYLKEKYSIDNFNYYHMHNDKFSQEINLNNKSISAFSVGVNFDTLLNDITLPGDLPISFFNSTTHFIGNLAESNTMITGSSTDLLEGGSKADSLNGGEGADTMQGFMGDDTYFVEDTADKVIEYTGQGQDSVISTATTYTLSANVENGTLRSSPGSLSNLGGLLGETLKLTGNSENNILTSELNEKDKSVLKGQGGDDKLYGGAGEDFLYGDEGDDFLLGGIGKDLLQGGSGSNTYFYGKGGGADSFIFSGDSDTILLDSALATESIRVSRVGQSLKVSFSGGDYFYIENWQATPNSFSIKAGDREYAKADILQALQGTIVKGGAIISISDTGAINNLAMSLSSGTNAGFYMENKFFKDSNYTSIYTNPSAYTWLLHIGMGNDDLAAWLNSALPYSKQPANSNVAPPRGLIKTEIVDGVRYSLFEYQNGDMSTRNPYINASYYYSNTFRNTATWWKCAILIATPVNGAGASVSFLGAKAGTNPDAVDSFDASYYGAPVQGAEYTTELVGTDPDTLAIEYGASNAPSLSLLVPTVKGIRNEADLYTAGSSSFTAPTSPAVAKSLNAAVDTLSFAEGDSVCIISGAYGATFTEPKPISLAFNKADLTFSTEGADLVIDTTAQDKLIIKDYFLPNTAQKLPILALDGEVLLSDLMAKFGSVEGTDGADTLTSGSSLLNQVVYAKGGDDTFNGTGAADTVFMGSGNDTAYGNDGNDTIYGEDGVDTLYGGYGDDNLYGGDGNDHLFGNQGNNYLDGGTGDDYLEGDAGIDYLIGGAGNDTLVAKAGDDILEGGDGNDSLDGGDGSNQLYGGSGNDTLQGGSGSDLFDGGEGDDVLGSSTNSLDLQGRSNTYIGGAGNDTIYGSYSGDTYVYNKGDGADTIIEISGQVSTSLDTLLMGSGIKPTDLKVKRLGYNLIIEFVADASQSITIKNWFYSTVSNGSYQIEQVKFEDGTTWTSTDLQDMSLTMTGTANNDTLTWGYTEGGTILGGDGNDTITGGANNDILKGENGNDSLIGGAGNDLLDGGDGNDALDGGAGQDTLIGGAGDDTLGTKSTADVGYASGTSFVSPGAGNIYEGGAGNDTLNGTALSDTYKFALGWGSDSLTEAEVAYQPSGQIDTIVFDASVKVSEIKLSKVGNDLVVFHTNGVDKITIKNWYLANAYATSNKQIEQLQFADGTIWNSADIAAKTRLYMDVSTNTTHSYSLTTATAANQGIFYRHGYGSLTLDASTLPALYKTGVLTFDSSISADSVKMVRNGKDLVLQIYSGPLANGNSTLTTDKITITNYFTVADGTNGYMSLNSLRSQYLNHQPGQGYYDPYMVSGMISWDANSKQYFINNGYTFNALGATKSADRGTLGLIEFSDGTSWNPNNYVINIFANTSSVDLSNINYNKYISNVNGEYDFNVGAATTYGGNYVQGGVGINKVYFAKGTGPLTVDASWGTNKLMMDPSLRPADVAVTKIGQTLYLTVKGSDDFVELANTLFTGVTPSTILFADGTTWSSDTLGQSAPVVTRLKPGCVISDVSAVESDLLGNLKVTVNYPTPTTYNIVHTDSQAPAFIFDNGKALYYSDLLGMKTATSAVTTEQDASSQVILFSAGLGSHTVINNKSTLSAADSIVFDSGINVENIEVTRQGLDLVISLNGTSDQITLKAYFARTGQPLVTSLGQGSALINLAYDMNNSLVVTKHFVNKQIIETTHADMTKTVELQQLGSTEISAYNALGTLTKHQLHQVFDEFVQDIVTLQNGDNTVTKIYPNGFIETIQTTSNGATTTNLNNPDGTYQYETQYLTGDYSLEYLNANGEHKKIEKTGSSVHTLIEQKDGSVVETITTSGTVTHSYVKNADGSFVKVWSDNGVSYSETSNSLDGYTYSETSTLYTSTKAIENGVTTTSVVYSNGDFETTEIDVINNLSKTSRSIAGTQYAQELTATSNKQVWSDTSGYWHQEWTVNGQVVLNKTRFANGNSSGQWIDDNGTVWQETVSANGTYSRSQTFSDGHVVYESLNEFGTKTTNIRQVNGAYLETTENSKTGASSSYYFDGQAKYENTWASENGDTGFSSNDGVAGTWQYSSNSATGAVSRSVGNSAYDMSGYFHEYYGSFDTTFTYNGSVYDFFFGIDGNVSFTQMYEGVSGSFSRYMPSFEYPTSFGAYGGQQWKTVNADNNIYWTFDLTQNTLDAWISSFDTVSGQYTSTEDHQSEPISFIAHDTSFYKSILQDGTVRYDFDLLTPGVQSFIEENSDAGTLHAKSTFTQFNGYEEYTKYADGHSVRQAVFNGNSLISTTAVDGDVEVFGQYQDGSSTHYIKDAQTGIEQSQTTFADGRVRGYYSDRADNIQIYFDHIVNTNQNTVKYQNGLKLTWTGPANSVSEVGNEVTLHSLVTDATLKFGQSTQTIAFSSAEFSNVQILLEKANNDFILKFGESGALVLTDEAFGSGVNVRLPDGALLGAQDLLARYTQQPGTGSVKLFGPTRGG